MCYLSGACFARHAPVMVFGSLLSKRPRTAREESVRNLAAALNALDYESVADLVTADIIVANVMGWRTDGYEAFVEKDRPFREGFGKPKIRIDDLIHHDAEILVRGYIESAVPDVSGPCMWRIGFDGPLISEIEITRTESSIARAS